MMIQLLIQFQKYILSTIYIYIFLSMSFSIESDSKVSMNFSRRYDSSHVSVTWFSYTHTRARDIRSGRELFPFSIHVSWGDVLEESDASSLPRKMERMREEEKRKRERERETMEFFFFLVPGELRARDWNIAQVVLCYGNGELTVTWIEENSIALTDEPEGRCFSWGKNGKIDDWGKNSCAAFDLKNFQLSLSDI